MIHDLKRSARQSFTLVELLVSISIITLLATMILVALAGVQESAKADRTRALIARIDALVSERWDAFPRRRVPMPRGANINTNNAWSVAKLRTDTLRELMRMELPDRKSDLLFPAVTPGVRTSGLWRAYRRRAAREVGIDPNVTDDAALSTQLDSRWTAQYQGAECLYLILSQMIDQDVSALEFFRDNEIGDIDGDRMPELLDGWGRPIRFLRWAPGFQLAGGPQDPEANKSDPLDPMGFYRTAETRAPGLGYLNADTFALYPLIFSAGPDGQHDVAMDFDIGGNFRYWETEPPNNPYVGLPPAYTTHKSSSINAMLGTMIDADGDGNGAVDNITNHGLIASR